MIEFEGEYRVLPKGKKFYRIQDGILICKTCSRLMKSGFDSKEMENDSGMLIKVPTWIAKPHLCLLSGLEIVEKYYKMLWISSSLYDRWMELNGGEYQLGNSQTCMKLWTEVTSYLKAGTPPGDLAIDEELVADIGGSNWIELVQCCKYRDRSHVSIIWANIRDKKELKLLDRIWKYSSEADHNKTNISASHIVWHGRKLKEFRNNFNRMLPVLGLSASNVTATAVGIHCLGNPSAPRMIDLCEEVGVCCLDSVRYAEFFKLVSVALRRSAHWPDGKKASLEEVAQCAGWELAIGRSMNISDWEEEEKKRTKQRMYLKDPAERIADKDSNDRYCQNLKKKVYELLLPLFVGQLFSGSYEDFIQNRQSWVSSGSSGGARIVVEGKVVRINKHVLFENLTKEEMVGWLDVEPIMEAVGSEKFEMGKARAIYGTKPMDYTISSYVLNEIEPRLNVIDGIEAGLTGIDVINGLLNRRNVARKPGVECSMIDYADFNYQHTLEAQAVVFEAVAELFEFVGANLDKVKAARWTAAALRNQWCWFPKSDKAVKITQGMFSGCRATNFLNTVLNLAYFHVASDWVFTNLSIRPIDLYHIHQGDDVWISNFSRLWAIILYRVMLRTNFDFQDKKQLFDICRAEFLRVLYSIEGAMGFIARAIATLIMKPIQSTDITGPAERAIAINSQINIIFRRGFSEEGARILWDAIVPYAGHVNLPKGGFSVPVSVMNLHPLNGGLGLLPPGQYSVSRCRVAPVPTYQADCSQLAKFVNNNMSKDWVDYVGRSIQDTFDSKALMEMVHEGNVSDSLRPKDKLTGLEKLEEDLRAWKTKLVLPVVDVGYHNMFNFFLPTVSSGSLETLLSNMVSNVWVKRRDKNSGMVRSICLAISLSPFKNVPAATVAMKGDWVSIVRACIGMCVRSTVQFKANTAFNTLLDRVGPSVTRLLIDGQNLGIANFEFRWHPIVLSFFSDLAREKAAIELVAAGIQDVNAAKAVIQHEFDDTLRVLARFEDFEAISRY
nr:MAG: RNA dependent RNA polymerase [Hanko totivirus 5]